MSVLREELPCLVSLVNTHVTCPIQVYHCALQQGTPVEVGKR